MILEARWFSRELSSGDLISTLLEITMEMAKETAQDDASEKKKKRRKWEKKAGKEVRRLEYGAVVQFPVSADPVASYLLASARTKSRMR